MVTGSELATASGLSLRSVYRWIGVLRRLGHDVRGEAGAGYHLRTGKSFRPAVNPATVGLSNVKKGSPMTYTIWSQAGRYEWILRKGEEIVHRSGLIYHSRGVAFTHLKRWMRSNGYGENVSNG
jgi:hypothetical protein